MSRDLRPSKRYAKRTYLENADISKMINDAVDSCEEKITTLETIVRTGLDYVLPLKNKIVFTTEQPWIKFTLKRLIKNCQRAFSQRNHVEFKPLRNHINLLDFQKAFDLTYHTSYIGAKTVFIRHAP